MSEFGKAVWILPRRDFPEGEESIKKVVRRLAEGGFNILIPCVKGTDGYIDYDSKVGNVRPESQEFDFLEVLAREAQDKGVKVHPWLCVFTEGKGSALLASNRELAAIDREGNTTRWACTARPEVQDYEFALYEEIMDNYDVAGVHLDYIRTGDGCYCDYCQQASGIDANIAELTSKDQQWGDWITWRASNVTKFVARVHGAAVKRGLEVSAAVFTEYPAGIASNGQDWEEWAKRGLVDYIFTMNYTNIAELAAKYTRNHIAILQGACPVWEGLGKESSGSSLTTPMLVEQIKAVLREGANGIVIFAYSALTDEDIEAIRSLSS